MADAVSLFRKGSLIPDVLTLETDLIERVEAARAEAAKTLAEARDTAERLLSETKRQLPRITEERRRELTEEAQGDTSAIEHDQVAALNRLKATIEHNREHALEAIIGRIVPDTDQEPRT